MKEKKKGIFRFLGTGASMGIPVIGCHCPVCTSSLQANTRMRASALLKVDERNFLIDCGPDFKPQALQMQLERLDGVILTHAHHDHTAGLDELRIFTLRSHQSLDCLLSMETLTDLKSRFYYLFDKNGPYAEFSTKFSWQILEGNRGTAHFCDLDIGFFSYEQGGMKVNGFKFGDLAYVTDIHDYSDTVFQDLVGVKTLILSALRFSPSPLHLTIDEAVDFARKVQAERTWLTHIAHDLDHEKTNAYLPDHIRVGYDGLQIEFELDILNRKYT